MQCGSSAPRLSSLAPGGRRACGTLAMHHPSRTVMACLPARQPDQPCIVAGPLASDGHWRSRRGGCACDTIHSILASAYLTICACDELPVDSCTLPCSTACPSLLLPPLLPRPSGVCVCMYASQCACLSVAPALCYLLPAPRCPLLPITSLLPHDCNALVASNQIPTSSLTDGCQQTN